MTVLLESAVRVSVVVSMALLSTALLRRRSAAVRHWVLAVGLTCASAMPAFELLAPRWGVPVTRLQVLAGKTVTLMPLADDQPIAAPVTAGTAAMTRRALPPASVIGSIWLVGVCAGLALMAAGFAWLGWIASQCEPVIDDRWITPARAIAERLGLRRDVALLQSTHDSLVVTWGFWHPSVILPAGASAWTDSRIRIVLGHELSHVHRADWMLQVMSGILRAIYWFNPLVWLACHRLRHESERACDDDVINLGMTGSEYASELLSIARTLRQRAWSPAPAMARPSSLQRRVSAMLNTSVNRRPVSVHVRLAVVAVAFLLACAVAGSGRAAQAAGAPVSGSFVDALRNAIPNVTLTLTNTETGEKQTSRSGADGSFTFDALPDGDYRGETSAPGFTDTHPFFRIVKGKSVQPSVIALALGSVEETVTVTSAPRPPTGAPVGSPVFRPRNPSDTISPPRKTRDVRAIYPPNRTSDEATVFLEGVIDTNGLMRGLQALQPADRDFAAAAMDAVNQWQFEPTLLHGVPVDTAIRITVGFVR